MPYIREKKKFDVVIVGGFGHVGLPLGIAFANKGLRVCLYDIDQSRAEIIRNGKMPFIEYEAEPILKKVLQNNKLCLSCSPGSISQGRYVIIAIGTPVDEYLNPKTNAFLHAINVLKPHLDSEQTVIVRSTVYPRTCEQILKALGEDKGWHVAYCPERIIEGYAVRELETLPQIVSALTSKALEDAITLFSKLSPKVIKTSVREAELIKLFSNAWRYIQFAATNQFYMMAHEFGVDYEKIRCAMIDGYGRAATLPTAGFAAGPCLLKDTMQLSAFSGNSFALGHAAMLINEGLPNFIVKNLSQQFDLTKTKVGILGMAFKANIDDVRDALSFKLWKILQFQGARVYCSDEHAMNVNFVSKEELLAASDIVIVGVPHKGYKGLEIPSHIHVVDLWGVTIQHAKRGVDSERQMTEEILT